MGFALFKVQMAVEWSFDSRYLAFRASPEKHEALLYVVDTTTGQEIKVVEGWDFAWSSSATKLAIYTGTELQVIDVPTGTVRSLLTVSIPNPTGSLTWLLTQNTIVFPADSKQFVTGIYTVNEDGKNMRQLLLDDSDLVYRSVCCLQTSPNGRYLAFVANFQTLVEVPAIATLAVLDINNGEVIPLAYHTSGPIAWSPNSTHIIFGSTEDEEGKPVGSWDLFQVSLSDQVITRLTYSQTAPNGVTW